MTSKSYYITLEGHRIPKTESSSEIGAWNSLRNVNKFPVFVSISRLQSLGYRVKKEERKERK